MTKRESDLEQPAPTGDFQSEAAERAAMYEGMLASATGKKKEKT